MKAFLFVVTILFATCMSQAESKPLYLSGTVPVRGDIDVKVSHSGEIIIRSNTPDKLKIQTSRRGPASVITASAP